MNFCFMDYHPPQIAQIIETGIPTFLNPNPGRPLRLSALGSGLWVQGLLGLGFRVGVEVPAIPRRDRPSTPTQYTSSGPQAML